MNEERFEQILNNAAEEYTDSGIIGFATTKHELCEALKMLHSREDALIQHYQGTMSDLMISIAQSQQTFLRLRGLIQPTTPTKGAQPRAVEPFSVNQPEGG